MPPTRSALGVVLAGALILGVARRAGAQEVVLNCGRSAAGQIKVMVDFPLPVVLAPSIYAGITGYAHAEPSFHSTFVDEPANDFFQFSTAANFQFILVGKSAGIEVWNDHGSGFLAVGESFFLGPSPFDSHPVWNIPNVRHISVQTMTLRLHDTNGIYADSAVPLTLSFKAKADPRLLDVPGDMKPNKPFTVPEPAASVVLIAMALAPLLRRLG